MYSRFVHIHNIFTHPLDISKDGFEMTCNPKSGSCSIVSWTVANHSCFRKSRAGKVFTWLTFSDPLLVASVTAWPKNSQPTSFQCIEHHCFCATVASCPGEYHSPGKIDSDIWQYDQAQGLTFWPFMLIIELFTTHTLWRHLRLKACRGQVHY